MSEIAAVLARIGEIQSTFARLQTLEDTGFAALLNDELATAPAPTEVFAPAPARAPAPAVPTDTGTSLARPVPGPVTSDFGIRTHPVSGARTHHDGIDFGAPTGTPVRAAAAGRVSYSGWMSGYGNVIVIDHPGGLQTLYAHQSALLARVGERVGRGEVIGRVGSTGLSTGPHLHFEVKRNGRAVNPAPFLGL